MNYGQSCTLPNSNCSMNTYPVSYWDTYDGMMYPIQLIYALNSGIYWNGCPITRSKWNFRLGKWKSCLDILARFWLIRIKYLTVNKLHKNVKTIKKKSVKNNITVFKPKYLVLIRANLFVWTKLIFNSSTNVASIASIHFCNKCNNFY